MEYSINRFRDFEIRHYDILDSTNEQAKRILDETPQDDLVVIAKTQTSGKGRNGRSWVSDQGNLFFSIIIRSSRISRPELISFVAALAISQAIKALGISSHIKWPNDILVDSKKLSGILIEKYKAFLIIGIGLNLHSFPAYLEGERKACCLNEYVSPPDDILQRLLSNFSEVCSELSENGFEPLRKKLVPVLYKFGQKVELDYPGEKIMGRIIDISSDGELVLDTSDGIRQFRAGEVFDL
jgi:BirA family biotin operon repressor/biotin-[acetyl-CoA-carboxylase] ligase